MMIICKRIEVPLPAVYNYL